MIDRFLAKEKRRFSGFFSESAAVLLVITISVFLVEALVMLVLSAAPEVSVFAEAIIDAGALVVLLSPTFYFLIYRPLRRQITKKEKAEEEFKRANSDLQAFNEMLRLAITDKPIEIVMQRCLSRLIKIDWLSIDQTASIFLVDSDLNRLNLAAHIGMTKQMLNTCTTVDIGTCLCGKCAESGEEVSMTQLDERHAFQYPGMIDHGHYVIPINRGDTVLGVMQFRLFKGHELGPKERDFLKSIAHLMSIIILRRKTSDILRASENRFRDISNTIGEWIWEVDASGRYTYASPMSGKILGLEPDEIVGKRFFYDFYVPHEREKLKEAVFSVFKEKRVFTKFPNRYFHKDGRIVVLETSGIPLLDQDGNLIGYRGSDRDITERIYAEDQMRYARKAAEAADRAKDAFLQSMSHELRTPMNGVIGMLGLLQDSDLSPPQIDYVETAIESAKAELELIDQILEFSRLELEPINPKKLPTDLHKIIEDIVEIFSVSAMQKGINLSAEYPSGYYTECLTDPDVLKQAASILVENAIKFTEIGEITISTSFNIAGDNPEVQISVSDTGIGFAPETAPIIFDRFTQADSSFSRRHGGAGVGLAACKRLVESIGGSIGAVPRLGKGSVFWIKLPMARANRDEPPANPII